MSPTAANAPNLRPSPQALELLFLLAAMVWLHRCRQGPGTHTWRGFSRRALKGWRTYLRVGGMGFRNPGRSAPMTRDVREVRHEPCNGENATQEVRWPTRWPTRCPVFPCQVALPSGAAICLDWWMYEAVVLVAGALPDAKEQLGAMGKTHDGRALRCILVGNVWGGGAVAGALPGEKDAVQGAAGAWGQ